VAAVGKPKREFTKPVTDEDLLAKVRELSKDGIKDILATAPKLERYAKVRALKKASGGSPGRGSRGQRGRIKDMVGDWKPRPCAP
jgi:polyribonucleotide nucleotidyltransferase